MSIYLSMKTDEALQARIKAWLPRLMAIFFVLNTLLIVGMVVIHPAITDRYLEQPWLLVFPAAALVAILAAYGLLRMGRQFWAFVASSAMILFLLVSGASRDLPEPPHLDDRPGVQPDHLQRAPRRTTR